MIHPILKCRLLCINLSSTVDGGRLITKEWYLFKYAHRMGMESSCAIYALTNIIYN